MLKIACLSYLLFPLAAAAGPFGEGVKLANQAGVDQAGCEGSQVIRKEVERTGVNFVDGATQSWSCAGVTPAEADAKRCPYPQNTASNNLNVRCYGNSRTEGAVVCLSKPSQDTVDAVYGRGVGKVKERRPRFEELHVLYDSRLGIREGYAYRMDARGCRVESFRGSLPGEGSTVDIRFKECAETMYNATHGGPVYPRIYPKDSKTRFCQPSSAENADYDHEFLAAAEKLGRCREYLPDFLNRYRDWRKEQRAGGGAAGGTEKQADGEVKSAN